MIKPYLLTLLFFPGFSCILPFYPAIIPFKYFPVIVIFLLKKKIFYMFATFASGKTNLIIWIITSTIPRLSSCQILYEMHPSHTINTYKFQPVCPLNLATYNSDEYSGKKRITGRNGTGGEDSQPFRYLRWMTSNRFFHRCSGQKN